MNTRQLQRITEKVDDIFHSEGYVLDHTTLSLGILRIIKERYPQEKLKLYIFPKFTGRGVPLNV